MTIKTSIYLDITSDLVREGWGIQSGSTATGDDGVILTNPRSDSEIHFNKITQGGLTIWEPFLLLNGGKLKFPKNKLELFSLITLVQNSLVKCQMELPMKTRNNRTIEDSSDFFSEF